jgi:hypothetical protein
MHHGSQLVTPVQEKMERNAPTWRPSGSWVLWSTRPASSGSGRLWSKALRIIPTMGMTRRVNNESRQQYNKAAPQGGSYSGAEGARSSREIE